MKSIFTVTLILCLSSFSVLARTPSTGCSVTGDSKKFALAYCAMPFGCDAASAMVEGSSMKRWLASLACESEVSKIRGEGFSLRDAEFATFDHVANELCSNQSSGILAGIGKLYGCIQSGVNHGVKAIHFEKCYNKYKSACDVPWSDSSSSSSSASSSRTTSRSKRPSWCSASGLNLTERTVCATSSLRTLDLELASVYRQAKANNKAQGQAKWLRKNRDWCGSSTSCISSAYSDRISLLRNRLQN